MSPGVEDIRSGGLGVVDWDSGPLLGVARRVVRRALTWLYVLSSVSFVSFIFSSFSSSLRADG